MNFTLKIKNQIIDNGLENACCKQAALAAFLRLSGSILSLGGELGFECVTECERAAEYFINLIEEMYSAEIIISGAKKDRLTKRDKIAFMCRGVKAGEILSELGIIGLDGGGYFLNLLPDKYLLEDDCCVRAYVKGAFLAAGSCSLPKSNGGGYHLEVIFSGMALAEHFAGLLKNFEINAKITSRKDSFIVYLKSGNDISDILALMQAGRAVLELNGIMAEKSLTNDINRAVNCMAGNLVKQLDASVRYIRAIEKLEAEGRLQALPHELVLTARLRREHENFSTGQLAELLNVSKSCLNRRLRKIVELAGDVTSAPNKNDSGGII